MADKFDTMANDTKTDLLRRSARALADGRMLLAHWQSTVTKCDDCKALSEETRPYLNGLINLLREIGG